jgi:hypothetical protein
MMTRVFITAGVTLLLTASVLAGCGEKLPDLLATNQPKVEPNLYPKDYKKAVIAFVTTNEQSSTSLRDAAISEPVLRPLDNIERYMSCVRYTPRNSEATEHLIYFIGGQINQFIKASPGQCSWATYVPFPDLEKICRGDKCK